MYHESLLAGLEDIIDFSLLARLIADRTAGLAGRLATGLAFAATGTLISAYGGFGNNFDMFHDLPPKMII